MMVQSPTLIAFVVLCICSTPKFYVGAGSSTIGATQQTPTVQAGAPVLATDIAITGDFYDSGDYYAYVGFVLVCNATCNPPPTSFVWKLVNTNTVVSTTSLFVPTQDGLLIYSCSVTNVVSGVAHNASLTLLLNVFPTPGPLSVDDITINGSRSPGTSLSGSYTAHLEETLTCTVASSPPANVTLKVDISDESVTGIGSASYTIPNNSSFIGATVGKCTAVNVYNGTLTSASKTLTITICCSGNGCWSKMTFTALVLQLTVALSLINRASAN